MARDQRHRYAAQRRTDQGYHSAFSSIAKVVADDDWMSQDSAAEMLGISLIRVGSLIQGKTLKPAHNSKGQAGVTRASVERERAKRHNAGWCRRTLLLGRDVLRSIAQGI